jgi:hypothetical protein
MNWAKVDPFTGSLMLLALHQLLQHALHRSTPGLQLALLIPPVIWHHPLLLLPCTFPDTRLLVLTALLTRCPRPAVALALAVKGYLALTEEWAVYSACYLLV